MGGPGGVNADGGNLPPLIDGACIGDRDPPQRIGGNQAVEVSHRAVAVEEAVLDIALWGGLRLADDLAAVVDEDSGGERASERA